MRHVASKRLALHTVVAVGNPDALEFSDVRATESKLKPLVEASGGGLMYLQDNLDPTFARRGLAAPLAARTGSGLRHNGGKVAIINHLPLPGILVALAF